MSDGRKRIRLRVVDPRTGRMKELDRIVEGTIEEALRLQQQWRLEVRTADVSAKEPPRLRDYVESWLRCKALRLKYSSATMYAETLGRQVVPYLGDFYVDKLTDANVRDWLVSRSQDVAAGTVNGALVLLRMVMADAVAEFRLAHNPTTRIRKLPVRRFTDEEPNLLAPDELARVLEGFRVHEPQHLPLAMMLALTGLRFGEATALKWEDIREAEGVIRVVRAQWEGHVSTTKTGIVRTVPLVPQLRQVLREHRAQLVARQAPGLATGWVFPEKDGGLLPKCALRRPLERVLKRLGITKRVTTHGLRRTFNNLSRQVAGEIVTRSITGHVTHEMTEHYSHVDRSEKLAAAGKVVRLVGLPSGEAERAGDAGDQVGDQVGDRPAGGPAFQSSPATP